MGTRGLVGHVIRRQKKASYNHFDSYPSALGVKLTCFIKSLSEEQIQQIIRNLAEIEWVAERSEPPEDLQSRYISAGFANLEVSNKTPGDWYCLFHKVQGAAALPYILDGTLAHMIDNTEFEEDRLFCEWVYYVDWEGRSVSVHEHGDDWSEKSFKELDEDWMLSLEACENVGDISSDEG